MHTRCHRLMAMFWLTIAVRVLATPAEPIFQLHLLSSYHQRLAIECRLQHAMTSVYAVHLDTPGFSAQIVPQKTGTLIMIRSTQPIQQDLIRMHPTVETSEGTVTETWIIHFDTQSIERITQTGAISTPRSSLQAGVPEITYPVSTLAPDTPLEAAEEKMYEQAILAEDNLSRPISRTMLPSTTTQAPFSRCNPLQGRVEKLEHQMELLHRQLQQLQKWRNG